MKASAKRLRHRAQRLMQLTPAEAQAARNRIIARWCEEYNRRLLTPNGDAEQFRLQKHRELLQIGATESDVRAFATVCMAHRLAVNDTQQTGAPTVPSHLISNYEAVEIRGLREVRSR